MKTIYKILILTFAVILWACEKNDPLADQGRLTGEMVPFNLLAQMPDAPAGDTLTLRNVSWAVNDDIDEITFAHRGFKLRTYDIKLTVPTSDSNNTVHELSTVLTEDSIITPTTQFAYYPEEGGNLDQYYQTMENAYVILHDFIVPQNYALTRRSNEQLINEMEEGLFTKVVEAFAPKVTRHILVAFFPEINPFSLVYFVVDEDGFYTGELTEQGMEYYLTNMNKEIFNDFLREATVADNTRVTIETAAKLENSNAIATSTRTFRIL